MNECGWNTTKMWESEYEEDCVSVEDCRRNMMRVLEAYYGDCPSVQPRA